MAKTHCQGGRSVANIEPIYYFCSPTQSLEKPLASSKPVAIQPCPALRGGGGLKLSWVQLIPAKLSLKDFMQAENRKNGQKWSHRRFRE